MRHQLVNGPLGTSLVERQGRAAAPLILLVCALTAVAYGLGSHFLRDRVHPPRRLGQALVASIALLLMVGLIASHPIRRFEHFKHNVQPETINPSNYTTEHLLGSGGNGRWQMWSAAGDQWQHHQIVGNGAGSFAEWWTRHGSGGHIKDAHSLYLETLGELGLVGFLILVPIFVIGASVGVRRSLFARDNRITTAALTAAFGAYTVDVVFDWMWELTVVSIVAWTILALALSSLKSLEPNPRSKTERGLTRLLWKKSPIVTTVVAAWLLIAAQMIPLRAQTQIGESQAAVARGDAAAAESAALKARRVQPWASSPALQLALVMEQEGNLVQASAWIREAIKNDNTNWNLWLISTRIDVKRGDVGKAKQSLRRAIELNPRSARMIQLERTLNEKVAAAPRS
jgi:multisubunit Na+/H+ antiporter MnhB subunit